MGRNLDARKLKLPHSVQNIRDLLHVSLLHGGSPNKRTGGRLPVGALVTKIAGTGDPAYGKVTAYGKSLTQMPPEMQIRFIAEG